MKFSTRAAIVFLFTTVLQLSFAQVTKPQENQLSLDDGTIESQFEYVFRKSGDFKGTNGQNYEAVRQVWLLKLKSNVLDSLKSNNNTIDASNATIEHQAKEITDLKSQLNTTQLTLDQTNTEKNSMALLGMQTSKTSYNVIMWSIIAALLALLLLFIFKFKNSNILTKVTQRKLEDVENEYEEHRRVALEREQKVRRQLQDEINKNKA